MSETGVTDGGTTSAIEVTASDPGGMSFSGGSSELAAGAVIGGWSIGGAIAGGPAGAATGLVLGTGIATMVAPQAVLNLLQDFQLGITTLGLGNVGIYTSSPGAASLDAGVGDGTNVAYTDWHDVSGG